jgi:putative glycosyltransferase (TIGR04348 family)
MAKIVIACPAPPGSLYGNRVTAQRWTRILRSLGHRVALLENWQHQPCDLLIALHARRSAPAALHFAAAHPARPLLVALTGTDLYRDIRTDPDAQRVLELATRLIALQPLAAQELPAHLRRKLRVILQSAPKWDGPLARPGQAGGLSYDVCVVGHLREVKDPFRAALASRDLPPSSRLRILHAGTAMENGMAEYARTEERNNPRYRWLGGLPQAKTRRLIASSRLLVLSSHLEGGANTISEALADGVPVLASRIPGSVGLLGARYPGYFPVGDTAALASLLYRAETDPRFYAKLKVWCGRLAPLFHPSRERAAWRRLLRETTRLPIAKPF